jgi:hypothetical protein
MRPRLTYANVMATVAVFIALGGASYAAFKLPKNSVGSKQLKKNSVTTAKIKKEAVTGAKVKLSTLGKVPSAARADSAANADAVQGVGISGLLRSDRILTGSASEGGAPNVVLRDERTGLEVLTGSSGRLRLLNTNSTDPIFMAGIGFFSEAEAHPTRLTIAAGEHVEIVYDATSFTYGQYLFMRERGRVPLQLTCSRSEPGSAEVILCIGVG